jgi:hypothetical protein
VQGFALLAQDRDRRLEDVHRLELV